MKPFIMLLMLFSCTLLAEDIAIEAVKKHPKIIELLSTKTLAKHWVEFHQMDLGGECGFTGCKWRKLVSVIVTSKGGNAISTTTIALVSGHKPNNINNITVEFVELTKLIKDTTQTKQQL
ncbi:MAG: hypothetical protein HRT55_20465 [Colwellia sp.]|uniref:hypothetical protein n=1 Tax=Colwellia sp. TaxID=56799 RepID=UPI0025BD061D|nr:hypothetical protein [Colwellia sp.]NQZ28681.1 hypothetical protein [Colwellia sp.]